MEQGTATLIAAFVVASTTIITIFVNVWSAKIARAENRDEKHREWLKDKQIKDVEIIIPTLSKFLNEMSSEIAKMIPKVNSTAREVHNIARAKQAGRTLDRFPTVAIADLGENGQTYLEDLWSLHQKRTEWFSFEAQRLVMWFEDSELVRNNLVEIAKKFSAYHYAVDAAIAEIVSFAQQRTTRYVQEVGPSGPYTHSEAVNPKDNIFEGDDAEILLLKKEFFDSRDKLSELHAFVLEFQNDLIEAYKHYGLHKPSESASEGLMVVLARRIEKSMRYLFSL